MPSSGTVCMWRDGVCEGIIKHISDINSGRMEFRKIGSGLA